MGEGQEDRYGTINARGDTVATKPAFRSAVKKRRCLVLADGYCEWEKSGKVKLPWFYVVDGGKPFAFAGLWESWQQDGANGDSGPLALNPDDEGSLAALAGN